jgi:hypothetical protein
MVMTASTRWKILPACGAPMLASLLRKRHPIEKRADKGELNEWENEGGNLAPDAPAPDVRDNTGSAGGHGLPEGVRERRIQRKP